MPSIADWKKDLDRVSELKKGPERIALVASVIAEALRSISRDPILVGGAAVEFYTRGKYSTADIDMVADGGRELSDLMLELGFQKMGKDFIDHKRKIYVEFPGSQLGAGEKASLIEVENRTLRVISIEDLIVDRLKAYQYWQSGIDGLNALLLLEQPEVDPKRLLERCLASDLIDALRAVQETKEEIIRKKLPPSKATELLEERKRKLNS